MTRKLHPALSLRTAALSSIGALASLIVTGLCLLALALPSVASAAECTDTWTGPAEGTWQTAADWSASHVPTESDVACIGSGKTVNVVSGEHRVGVLQGEGTVQISESTLEVMSEGENSEIAGLSVGFHGILGGPGTVRVSNDLFFDGTMSGSGSTVLVPGASGELNGLALLSERILINEGTLGSPSSTLVNLTLRESAKLENTGTLEANFQNASGLVSEGAGSLFVNTGSLVKTEGTGATRIAMDFENLGTVDAESGSFAFNSAAATATLANGSELSGSILIDGGQVVGDDFTAPSGSVKVTSGRLSIAGSHLATIANLEMEAGGEIAGAGILAISNSLIWEGLMDGPGATVLLPGASGTVPGAPTLSERTFINEGTLTTTATSLVEVQMQEGAILENAGTFDANFQSSSGFSSSGPGGSAAIFVNTGTLNKTEGSGNTKFSVNFENRESGTVDAESGTFAFNNEGRIAVLSSGSQLVGSILFNGTSVVGEDFTASAGTVDQTAGLLLVEVGHTATIENLESLGTSLILGAGDLKVSNSLQWSGSSTMAGSGATYISPGASGSFTGVNLLSERSLINEGTMTFPYSFLISLRLSQGAVLENLGTFDANGESAAGIGIEGGGAEPLIRNLGTFHKTEGGGTTKIGVNFENLGSLGEESGHLEIQHAVKQASSNKFSKECETEDPVNCSTGNFSESQTDFAIGGFGVGLDLTRTYSAQAAAVAGSPGIFGYGWIGSFSDHLVSEESGNRITLASGDGSTVPFTKSGASYKAPNWSQDTLSGSAEAGYTLILPDQSEWSFSGVGRLESVTDRNGNETTLAYEGSGHLETITDPAGREITLAYNGGGEVESAEDPMGHVVKYGYEAGWLASVTMPGEAEPRWQFKYDGSHRITQIIDGLGGKTINEYDGSNRVVSQTDPAKRTLTFEYAPFHTTITNQATGSVTDEWFTSNNEPSSITRGFGTADASTETFFYNAAGQLLSRTDGLGHKTTYAYDANGDRTSEKDPAGDETKWTFDSTHDVISATTPEGEKTTITRDANGNPETVSRPAPGKETQTTSFEYGPHGELESLTDPLSHIWSYEYDSQGDRAAEVDPEGDKRTAEYDEDSRLISTVSPRGNEAGAEASEFTTSVERDPQGRPIKIINPLGGTTEYEYDPNGNLEVETDPNGHSTHLSDNADNELTKVERPNGDTEETGYDGAGEVISQTDGNNAETTYVRNVLEEPIEVIDPLERKTTETFDAAGNLESETDPEARTTSYAYDAANRLKEVSYSDGVTPSATFGYDKDSNLTSIEDGTGESSYEYDELDRLIHSEDGHGDSVSYGYNLGEEQIGLTYPNGKSISRLYDNAGRLESLTDWLGHSTSFAYNPDSALTATTFPVGTGDKDEYGYDQADRMSGVTMKKGAETLASLTYTRDPAGQLESLISKGLPGAETESFGYDENERLTEAGAASYEYDATNNLTEAPGTTNEYDAASQLEAGTGATYGYDEEGERTKLTPSSAPATAYKYDQAGNLTAVERAKEGAVPAISETNAYDGSGLLASRSTGGPAEYLTWDQSTSLPLLLADGENSYVYGPSGLPIEQICSGETPTYLHHDQLGSTRALTNATGEVSATFTYGPYGGVTGHTGSATTPIGFVGQYTDSQSGLQYLRARFYDPATAQFLTKDPIEAQTRQPYGYAVQDPINESDPSGQISAEGVAAGADGVCAGTWEVPILGEIDCGGAIAATAASAVAAVASEDESIEIPEREEDCPPPRRALPYRGQPNSTDAIGTKNGGGQIRDYGPDGRPRKDFDFGHDHNGAGDPHAHDWHDGVRSPARPIGPGE